MKQSKIKDGTEFYILFKGEGEEHTMFDSRKLGHVSFGTFKINDGYKLLKQLITQNKTDILEDCRIVDSSSKTYEIDKFLKEITSIIK